MLSEIKGVVNVEKSYEWIEAWMQQLNRRTVHLSLGLSSRSVIYKRNELRIVTLTTKVTRQYSCVNGSKFFYYLMS